MKNNRKKRKPDDEWGGRLAEHFNSESELDAMLHEYVYTKMVLDRAAARGLASDDKPIVIERSSDDAGYWVGAH